jgi:hypothetical protein
MHGLRMRPAFAAKAARIKEHRALAYLHPNWPDPCHTRNSPVPRPQQ